MELFSISCTTCQKRLKVRDASLIGEILICPNCGSMVLVSPPDNWHPDAEDGGDTVEEIEPPSVFERPAHIEQAGFTPPPLPVRTPTTGWRADATHDVEDPFEQPPPTGVVSAEPMKPPVESNAAAEPPVFETIAPPLPDGGRRCLVEDTEGLGQDAGEQLEFPGEYDLGSEPVPFPDSPAAQRRRQWVLVVVAAVVGIGMSVILLGLWASRNGDASPELTQSETVPVADEVPDVAEDQADPAEPAQAVVEPKPNSDLDPAEPAVGEPAPAEPGPAEADTVDMPVDAPRDDPDGPDPAPSTKVKLPDDSPLPKTAAKTNETVPPEVSKPNGEPPDAGSPDTAALTRALQAFAPFIQDEPYTAPDPANSDDSEEPMLEVPEFDGSGTDQISIPRPEPREVKVADRLRDTIPELDISGMPLISFAHFVTGLSTIPISLDPDALALMRISPDRPVAVKTSETDVGGILTAALQPLGLGYVQVDDQLLVTRPVPASGEFRSLRHPVGDLVGGSAEQVDQLAEWITTVIEPDSWDVQGGPGSLQAELPDLVIRHQDTVLFHTLLFCERLRVARGLPTKTNLDPGLSRLEPRFARIQPMLQKPVRIRYSEPTLMLQILQRLTQDTGLQILVDWQALGKMGWTPAAETVLQADGVPVAEALTNMLSPMDLTYRVVDAATVQITSPEADKNHWDIEFYPVKHLLGNSSDATALMDRLAVAMQQSSIGESEGLVYFDPASRHLIAAMSQPHQRWLAELLDRWRLSAPAP
ncbi:MAG: hypothetical protein KJ000_06215 [Pirellulaceae bacterium]|nr:hypothetical protein [Pirellulaceae bacterium]